MQHCTAHRTSIEDATGKKQLGVAVPVKGFGLVSSCQRIEVRELGDSASLGESVVLEQDLDLGGASTRMKTTQDLIK